MAVTITGSGQSATAEGRQWNAVASSRLEAVSASSGIFSASAEGARAYVAVSTSVAIGGYPYGGSYFVSPSAQHQRLRTRGMTLADDVVIAPIPSNYGLVTWNGSVLTVS